MIDLSTSYVGLPLRTPLVASSSPLCKDIKSLHQMEEAGAAAVVLHSLFEEQITLDAESTECFLNPGTTGSDRQPAYDLGVHSYLDHLGRAKTALRIPVIGSLNGASNLGWVRYARDIQDAGADALELNISFVAGSVQAESSDIEQRYCDLVENVKSRVRIPVAVKLGPYFTSFANMAHQLDRAGADALVLFNRFYQPGFDIETLEITPDLTLSTSEDLRLRLHWVALLSSRIPLDLAITGGVHTMEDVVKGIMAGAQVVMLTSALLRRGILYLQALEQHLIEWMEQHHYISVDQMRYAMNPENVARQRNNYVKVITSYKQ
jgi:dihydroorotate dehydrogenase (fumarate)